MLSLQTLLQLQLWVSTRQQTVESMEETSEKNTIVYSTAQASKIIMELKDPNQKRPKLGRNFFQWEGIWEHLQVVEPKLKGV